jgi:phosphatidylglycerophosphate synthase
VKIPTQSIIEQMSQPKKVVNVSPSSSLKDLLSLYRDSADDIVLVDEISVISEPHLQLLTDYPRTASAALVGRQEDNLNTLAKGGRVVSAESASHTASRVNRTFAGAIRLSKSAAAEIEPVLEDAIRADASGSALDLLLVALVRANIRVDVAEIKEAPFARTIDFRAREKVKQELSEMSIPRLRLKMANRPVDGFFSVLVLRRLSKPLTWLAVKIGVTPNQVTIASFAVGLLAAYFFAQGDTLSLVVGALLLQLSIVVDCVDGELARYTRQFSELGAWLDAITDRVKEYVVFLGLAYGAFVQNGTNLWLLAALLMILQTFRHLSDYNFTQVSKARASEVQPLVVGFLDKWDGIELKSDLDEPVEPNQNETLARIRHWIRKMIVFPIGERWLLISATAAIGGAMFTFTVMPFFAFLSMFWVYRVRIRKTLEMAKTKINSNVIKTQLDLGFETSPALTRFDWLEPSLLRGLELLTVTAVLLATDNLGVTGFVVLLSIAYHHYDNLYRAMQNEAKPKWLGVMGLSAPGRVIIISAAALLGISMSIVAVYVASVFLVVSSVQWVYSHRTKAAG